MPELAMDVYNGPEKKKNLHTVCFTNPTYKFDTARKLSSMNGHANMYPPMLEGCNYFFFIFKFQATLGNRVHFLSDQTGGRTCVSLRNMTTTTQSKKTRSQVAQINWEHGIVSNWGTPNLYGISPYHHRSR